MDLFDIAVASKLAGGGGGGGGGANTVRGSIKTQSSAGVQTISVPYSGTGFPVFVAVFPSGGSISGPISTIVQYHGVIAYMFMKGNANAPGYAGSGGDDNADVAYAYKDSGTNASSRGMYGATSKTVFTQNNPSTTAAEVLKMSANNIIKINVATANDYGFVANADFEYVVVYSS